MKRITDINMDARERGGRIVINMYGNHGNVPIVLKEPASVQTNNINILFIIQNLQYKVRIKEISSYEIADKQIQKSSSLI